MTWQSPWLSMLPAAVVLCVGSWLSYRTESRASPSYPWVMCSLAAVNAALWVWASRRAADNREVYSLSVCYDVMTLIAYNLLPLVVCGVRISFLSAVGVFLVVLGVALVKWG